MYFQPNGSGVPNALRTTQPGQDEEGFWAKVPRIYPEQEIHEPELRRIMVDIGNYEATVTPRKLREKRLASATRQATLY